MIVLLAFAACLLLAYWLLLDLVDAHQVTVFEARKRARCAAPRHPRVEQPGREVGSRPASRPTTTRRAA